MTGPVHVPMDGFRRNSFQLVDYKLEWPAATSSENFSQNKSTALDYCSFSCDHFRICPTRPRPNIKPFQIYFTGIHINNLHERARKCRKELYYHTQCVIEGVSPNPSSQYQASLLLLFLEDRSLNQKLHVIVSHVLVDLVLNVLWSDCIQHKDEAK